MNRKKVNLLGNELTEYWMGTLFQLDLKKIEFRANQILETRNLLDSMSSKKIPTQKGRAKVLSRSQKIRQRLRQTLKLLIRLTQLLLSCLNLFSPSQKYSKIVIFFGLSRQHTPPAVSIDELNKFMRGKNIALADPNTLIVVQSDFAIKNQYLADELILCGNLSETICKKLLCPKQKVRLVFKLIFCAPLIVALVLNSKFPTAYLNAIPEVLVVEILRKSKIQLVAVASQSDWLHEPLIFFQISRDPLLRTVMLYYSENLFMYSESQLKNQKLIPKLENVITQEHWVWTEELADFYNSRSNLKNFIPKGPIIFRDVTDLKRHLNPHKKIVISIFDDAPTLENEWIHHSDLDSGLRFLEAIPKLFKILKQNSIDPYIQIKQKRRRINSHFDSYLETLNNLYEADYAVELHWSFDLAKCVLESDLVICAIATSPALLARYFGVPVAYYFGGIHTLGKPPIDYGIPIFFSPLELSKWILTKL